MKAQSVLIPSSSGQGFKRTEHAISATRRVLIPSSSGQGFKPATEAQASEAARLNPFFIRARFQTLSSPENLSEQQPARGVDRIFVV